MVMQRTQWAGQAIDRAEPAYSAAAVADLIHNNV